jgi:predicted DCC family thiol-disulfide oxidoreductase YuxK
MNTAAENYINVKEQGLIFFDGDCGFCNRWIAFIRKSDAENRFHYIPQKSETAAIYTRLTGLNFENQQTVIYLKNGKMLMKSDAVLAIFYDMGRHWKMSVLLKIFPAFLRNKIYDWIAGNRHRFGSEKSCSL